MNSNTGVSTACLSHPSNSKNLHQLSFFATEQKQQPHIFLYLDILLYLKVMWESESGSCSVLSDSLWPHGLYIQSMEFSRPEYWSWLPLPSPGDLPDPGIKPRSLTLQVDSLPTEPPGKPKNTGVGSLSLLQQIFPTQESNQGLRILYQLSYHTP